MTRLTSPVSDRDHAQGEESAPVTLVEYGDYECPACGAAYPVVKELQARLQDEVRFVFRNFPLSQIHPHAEHAAEAAEAAGEQGKFWEMHDCLFEHQRQLDDEHLARYADELSLDTPKLLRELAEGTQKARVREDFMSGMRSGVNGTPTFFINGERHDDSYEFDALLKAITHYRHQSAQ
jgi:protein-disulfide isomerase